MNTDLLVLRTHARDPLRERALATYRTVRSLDFLAVVENNAGDSSVEDAPDCIGIRNLDLDRLDLPFVSNWAWRCGDYFLYFARDARPNYTYYWMIEADVLLSFEDLDEFFASFWGAKQDLLGVRVRESSPSWSWYPDMARLRPRVFGMLFPVVRMSARAIDCLLERRIAARPFAESDERGRPGRRFPNDESFVATECNGCGFAVADLNDFGDYYDATSFTAGRPFNREWLMAQPADRRIYHPVLERDRYHRRLHVFLSRPGLREHDVDVLLDHAGRAVHETPECLDRMLTRHVLEVACLALANPSTRDHVLRRFAPLRSGPVEYAAIARSWKNDQDVARATDFEYVEAFHAPVLESRGFVPYAIDGDRETVSFVGPLDPRSIDCNRPLHAVQRDCAACVAHVAFGDLEAVFPTVAAAGAPTFVSVVDDGSGAFVQAILRSARVPAFWQADVFSEPTAPYPAFDATVREDADVAFGRRSAERTALRAAVLQFAAWSDAAVGELTFVLRPPDETSFPRLFDAFPNARFVFVFPRVSVGIRKRTRNGFVFPKDRMQALRCMIGAHDWLAQRNAKTTAVRSVDLVERPGEAVSALAGRVLGRRGCAAVEAVVSGDDASARAAEAAVSDIPVGVVQDLETLGIAERVRVLGLVDNTATAG